ncbi:PAAR domain-containing protein [Paraburkholderia adhaesiva]|uniref:PAAR domain-containing protein n=1 Tax=Paraburkholderia adhaesiva TaxID=2883244 RepID=UPI001F374AAD|nr:PAAR domain-containing protein [Paraburkholderia adhaesiva]
MMRRIAVVGDQLETGGQVLPYSGPVFTIGDAGHQVALIGGTAWCEACKSTGVIAKAGGPRRIDFMGETAADRDIVLCKCPTPPQIVATLSGDSWCDDMAETMGVATPTATRHGVTDAGASCTASPVIGQYDDHFVLRNADGQVLTHTAYAVQRKSGIFEYGETDDDGHTHLLASTASAENVNVYLAG